MKRLSILVVFFVTVLVNTSITTSQNPILTRDNYDQLGMVDQIAVGDFNTVVVDPSGRYFAVATTYSLATFDHQENQILSEMNPTHPAKHIALASDSSFFIYTAQDRDDGTDIGIVSPFHSIPLEGPITAFRFDAEPNEIILIAEDEFLLAATKDGKLSFYQTSDQTMIRQWDAHLGAVVDVLEINEQILSIGVDNRLRGWDQEGQQQFEIPLPEGVPLELISNQSDTAYIAMENGTLIGVDLNTYAILFSVEIGITPIGIAYDAGNDRLIVVNEGGIIRYWNALSGGALGEGQLSLSQAIPLTVMLIDPSTDMLVVGGFDGYLHWLDETGQIVQSRRPSEFLAYYGLDIYGAYVAINTAYGGIRIWDIDHQQWIIVRQDSTALVAFSSDGRWLATITSDNYLLVWEVGHGFAQPEYIISIDHPIGARLLHFIEGTSYIALGRSLDTIAVWDFMTGDQIAILPNQETRTYISAIASRSDLLAVGYGSGEIRFWEVPVFAEIFAWGMKVQSPIVSLAFGSNPHDLFVSSYSLQPPNPGYNQYQYRSLPTFQEARLEPGWNVTASYGAGEFEIVRHGSTGVALSDTGFFAFPYESGRLLLGKHDYELGSRPWHLALSDEGSFVAIGMEYDFSVWAVDQ